MWKRLGTHQEVDYWMGAYIYLILEGNAKENTFQSGYATILYFIHNYFICMKVAIVS